MKNLKETVIQFGEGGFLRGFADWMIQKMNDQLTVANDQLTDADELYNEDIYIGSYKYASETEDFFEIKDEFLADFKKNRISAYNIVSIKTLDIRVNPADVQRIALH